MEVQEIQLVQDTEQVEAEAQVLLVEMELAMVGLVLEETVLHLQLLDLPEPREPKVQLAQLVMLAQREPQVLLAL